MGCTTVTPTPVTPASVGCGTATLSVHLGRRAVRSLHQRDAQKQGQHHRPSHRTATQATEAAQAQGDSQQNLCVRPHCAHRSAHHSCWSDWRPQGPQKGGSPRPSVPSLGNMEIGSRPSEAKSGSRGPALHLLRTDGCPKVLRKPTTAAGPGSGVQPRRRKENLSMKGGCPGVLGGASIIEVIPYPQMLSPILRGCFCNCQSPWPYLRCTASPTAASRVGRLPNPASGGALVTSLGSRC